MTGRRNYFMIGAEFLEGQAVTNEETFKCDFCGEVVNSPRIRDLYRHILERHPNVVLNGTHCRYCQKMIPLGLSASHMSVEHNIKSAGAVDAAEMRHDYAVLQMIKEKRIPIVEPKRQFPTVEP